MASTLTGRSIARRDFLIDSVDPGIQLHLREKRPADVDRFTENSVVLCVHGATHPSPPVYDFQYRGQPSWLDYLAGRGLAAYCLDIRGYGGSTRPPAMSAAPADNPPFARAEEAIRDIGAAVDHLRRTHGVDRVNLIGFSWGTQTTGMFVSRHSESIRRLVLYGAAYSLRSDRAKELGDPAAPDRPRSDLGAYRVEKRADTLARWDPDVSLAHDPAAIRPPDLVEAYLDQLAATDPESAQLGGVRAPNGVLIDLFYRSTGRPIYDAGQIRVPVLLIRGELDRATTDADSQGLFAALTRAPIKRYVIVGQGTHWLAVEANRFQLYREVQLFLEEETP